ILFAIGAGGQMVGRDMFSDYPPEALALADVGGSYGEMNTEAIVALQPDLVLAAEIHTPDQVQALEDLGLTVFYLANPATLEGLYENIAVVAQLAGRSAEAETLVAGLKARVTAVDEALAGVEDIPSVFYELDGSDPNAPWTAGAGTFIDTLIARAKGSNIGGVLQGSYAQFSIEQLVLQDPAVILLGDAVYGVTPELVAGRQGWEGLSAVANGQVLAFDDNLVSRPGPRLIDGLEALAALLHPEAFAE
ncbi:MAG: ABC transporter substrate-binding protein, partial [Anaerolineae bacterium]|nr:ABC transporter substrate-binding protein [Anaerolineae bacterium]